MRLTCPDCAAQYEIGPDLIADEGRDVQCSACGHVWVQYPDGRTAPLTVPSPGAGPGPAAAHGAPEPRGGADPAHPERPVGTPADDGPIRPELGDDTRRILREEAEREAALRRSRLARDTSADASAPRDDPASDAADTPQGAAARPANGTDRPGDATTPPVPEAATEPTAPGDTAATAATAAPSSATASPRTVLEDGPDAAAALGAIPTKTDKDRARPTPPDTAGGSGGVILSPDPVPEPPQSERSGGFGTGFLLVLVLCALLAGLYLFAPDIAQGAPGLEPALAAYVEAVNALRDGALALGAAIEASLG